MRTPFYFFAALIFPNLVNAQSVERSPLEFASPSIGVGSDIAVQQVTGSLVGFPVLLMQLLIAFLIIGAIVAVPVFFGMFKPMRHFSREKAFAKGWALMCTYRSTLFKYIIGWQIISLLPAFVGAFIQNTYATIFSIILSWIVFIFMGIIFLGILLSMYDRSYIKSKRWSEYVPHWRTILSFFIALFLYIFGIILGGILFLVPGIFFAVAFLFSPFYIIKKHAGPFRALKMSFEITKGSRLDLFFLLTVCAFINIAGTLLFYVGIFITVPLTIFVLADIYHQLATRKTYSI